MKKIFWIVFLFFGFFLLYPTPIFAAISITNVTPVEINSPDDVFTVTISASSLQSNPQYLQLGLTAVDNQTNLFGKTRNNSGDWYVYDSSPSSSDLSSTFYNFTHIDGSWEGQVNGKVDITDEGYIGSGQYNLRLYKYTISSSGNVSSSYVSWLDPLTINIILSPTPTPSPSSTPTPTKSPTPTKTPTPTPTLKSTSTSKPTPTSSKQIAANTVSAPSLVNPSEDVKQTASKDVLPTSPSNISKNPSAGSSGKVLGASQNNLSKILIGLGIILLAACGILAFHHYKKSRKDGSLF